MSPMLLLIWLSVLAIIVFAVVIAMVVHGIVIESKKIKRGDYVRGYERNMGEQDDEYSRLLKVFGLTDAATEEEIKAAYRKYVKENHPDSSRTSDPDHLKRFMEVKKTYDRLVDIKSKRFGGSL